MGIGNTILCISDTQYPFHHQDSFDFLIAMKRAVNPNIIVHMGDELDFHCLSKYTKNPDGMSAGRELDEALVAMRRLFNIFPNVYVCTSNHMIRPYLRAMDVGIPKRILKTYAEFLDAPKGWVWADRWEIDGIIFEHGENVSGQGAAIKAARDNIQSTVIGHIHAHAGISYIGTNNKLIFGFNTGCLIDVHAYAFAYGGKIRHKPVLGCGVIIDGVPHFMPMKLDKDRRWTGKL